jgi:regulator of sirC expression with transglutaminase-like and TPR domain
MATRAVCATRAAAEFALLAGDPAAPPEQIAAAIARLAYPDLDAGCVLAQLDDLADAIAPAVQSGGEGRARADALLAGVTQQLGFHGNRTRYYEAANSYLNVVLERRTGLPILLCVVCMALGRRLGLDVEGVGLPGHFMARYVDARGAWLLDPFHGKVVEPPAVEEYLARLFERPVHVTSDLLAPVTPMALAQRILNNLRMVYLTDRDDVMAGRVVDFMLALTPNSTFLWQERGVLAYRVGDLETATRGLRRYFFLRKLPQALIPDADENAVRELPEVDRQLLQLLHEVNDSRIRLN